MIDTHAHLYMFEENGKNIIKNMKADGLDAIACIGTTIEDSKLCVEIANQNKDVYAVVGIYPEYAGGVSEEDLLELKKIAKNDKVIAIGEIGLDYHNGDSQKELQQKLFVRQLEIADELGLPFCVHCRGAVEDVFKILSENKHLINHSGLMHCYSEGAEWFEKFLSLGLSLSFSGNITFKKSDRSFLSKVPLDKILVETDSPYLSPEPLRGKINEPKNTRLVIDKIALEIGLTPEKLEKITTENARKFYFKMEQK